MRSILLFVLLGSASVAHAQTRMTVVGMGDCSDPDLVRSIGLVADRLALQPSVKVAGPDLLENRLGAEPQRSIEEIQRQIDSAQQLFYQAQYHTALERLGIALTEIDRLPPGMPRWHLSVGARLLEALIRGRIRDGKSDAEESFRYVLRLDPKHQLDPDYFSPSTIKEFDRIRAKLAKEGREKLTVNSRPAGTTVYLDGREVGRTPFDSKLPAGEYVLQLGKGKRFSVPRTVSLRSPAEVIIDFEFEGAIASRQPPCFDATDSEAERLKQGTTLGSLLGVDQVVMLRHERREIGPGWLAATLIGVVDGRKIREGGLELRKDSADDAGITELARFVATGEKMSKVRVIATPQASVVDLTRPASGQPGGTAPVVVELASAAAPTVEAAPSAPVESSAQITANPRDARSGTWMKPTSYGLFGVGAAAAITGLTFQLRAGAAQKEYDTLAQGGITADEASAARSALDASESSRTIATAGFGVGAAALVGGTVLWFLAPHDGNGAPAVTLAPSLDAQAPGAVFSGRF